MLAPEIVGFLEGGCALIVAAVDAGGEPYATRGWGLRVTGDAEVRLLLPAEDERAVEFLQQTAAIAITGGDVVTLRSVQCKGSVTAVEPATADDLTVVDAYREAFFHDLEETDGTPRSLLDRLLPIAYTACSVTIDSVFDQTPGPAAGSVLGRA